VVATFTCCDLLTTTSVKGLPLTVAAVRAQARMKNVTNPNVRIDYGADGHAKGAHCVACSWKEEWPTPNNRQMRNEFKKEALRHRCKA
jgi:hypothetical protein